MSDRSPSVARGAADSGGARPVVDEKAKKNLLAGGGVLGALAMASCCIVPLVLFSLGVTSAWIGTLAGLYPYKLYFLIPTAGFLAGGFYMAYRRPAAGACEGDTICAAPVSDRINKAVLWGATILVLAALAFPYTVPLLLES